MLAGSGYSRTTSKASHWLLVQLDVGDRQQDFVAQAHNFLKVTPGAPSVPLQLLNRQGSSAC